MKEMNITILLPVHKIDGDYKEMLDNAVKSVEQFYNDVNLMVICPESISKDLDNLSDKLNIEVIPNKGKTDFCSQINLGIENVKTSWFSILEIDDEFSSNWLKSMTEYVVGFPEVDVLLPIVKDINTEGKFLSFTNESVWAYGFCETQGFLDNETLIEFQNYQTSGGLYKTSVVKENGKFKENIKLTFIYEFLLRLTHNGTKIMTVPKIGYQHVNFREDSLFWNYKEDENSKMDESEIKFWVDTAKKEFFFKNKRDVTYSQN